MSLKDLIAEFWECAITDRWKLIDCIRSAESQLEDWFKAELLCFLKRKGLRIDREVKAFENSGKKVDLQVESEGQVCLIELKHLIQRQKGSSYGIGTYFLESSNALFTDINKLRGSTDKYERYVLSFISGYRIIDDESLKRAITEGLNKNIEHPDTVVLLSSHIDTSLESGYFLLKIM